MHIVFLTNEYPKHGLPHGGIGTFIQTLGRWLVKAGHNISVVGVNYVSDYDEELDFGVRIYRIPKQNSKGLSWYLNTRLISNKIREINEAIPIDVIDGPESAFAFLPKLPNVKYLIRLHGGHHFFAESENRRINMWKGLQEKLSFKKADAVVGVSRYSIYQTLKFLDFKDKLKGVINCHLDLSKFRPSNSSNQRENRILFVGTIREKKGIRQLIQAMPIVKTSFPNAELVIVGRDSQIPKTNKSYVEFLKPFIDSSVRNSIHFLGSVSNSDIPILIEESEICCYPSHMETFGIVAIEALAMGKPVIFTKFGPGPEIIKHGETGLLCNPLDPEDIAKQIIWLFQNKNKAQELGSHGREFVLKNFSLDSIGPQNILLYETLR